MILFIPYSHDYRVGGPPKVVSWSMIRKNMEHYLEPGVMYMVRTVLTDQIYRYLYTRAHYPIVTMFGD